MDEMDVKPRTYYKAVKVEHSHDGKVTYRSKYRNTKWVLGQTNTLPPLPELDGQPSLCKYGFHACNHPAAPFLEDALGYGYTKEAGDVLLEVVLHGFVVTDGIKSAALSCTPVKVVTPEEYEALVKGPAVLKSVVSVVWQRVTAIVVHLLDGELHSPDEDTPAVVNMTCNASAWYRRGKLHREGDKPAIVRDVGCAWFVDNKRHRDKGPAAIALAGLSSSVAWYKEGILLFQSQFCSAAHRAEAEAIIISTAVANRSLLKTAQF